MSGQRDAYDRLKEDMQNRQISNALSFPSNYRRERALVHISVTETRFFTSSRSFHTRVILFVLGIF